MPAICQKWGLTKAFIDENVFKIEFPEKPLQQVLDLFSLNPELEAYHRVKDIVGSTYKKYEEGLLARVDTPVKQNLTLLTEAEDLTPHWFYTLKEIQKKITGTANMAKGLSFDERDYTWFVEDSTYFKHPNFIIKTMELYENRGEDLIVPSCFYRHPELDFVEDTWTIDPKYFGEGGFWQAPLPLFRVSRKLIEEVKALRVTQGSLPRMEACLPTLCIKKGLTLGFLKDCVFPYEDNGKDRSEIPPPGGNTFYFPGVYSTVKDARTLFITNSSLWAVSNVKNIRYRLFNKP